MRTPAAVLAMAKPRVMALLCLLALAGAAASPGFLAADFRPGPLAATPLFRWLEHQAPAAFSPPLWSLAHALGAMLAVALLWAGTALVNDLADVGIDRISAPGRPLAAGAISRRQAWAWAVGLQAGALLLSLLAGRALPPLAVLAGLALGNGYSLPPLRLRRQGWAAAAIIGAGCALAVAGGALAQGPVGPRPLLLALRLGLLAGACSLVKDFKDQAGDAAAGVRTLPVLLGPAGAARAVTAAVAAAYGAAGTLLALAGGSAAALVLHGALGVANLALLVRVTREPVQVYRLSLLLYMGVTVIHVVADRP